MEIAFRYTRCVGPDYTPDAGTVTFDAPPFLGTITDLDGGNPLERWAEQPDCICDQIDEGDEGDESTSTHRVWIIACFDRPDLVGQFLEWG